MKDSVKKEFEEKTKTATDAVKCVQSGDVVYIGTCTSTSYHLARALDDMFVVKISQTLLSIVP